MAQEVFRTASVLRACHEAYAQQESARRAARIDASRGDAAPLAPELSWIPWGKTTEIPAVIDAFEAEYAAIRSGAALCDQPQRGVLSIGGALRRDFLQRMLTQDLKGLATGVAAEAFWLNRKGRIEADLLLCEVGDRVLVDCAASVAATTAAALTTFVFSEEVIITDASDSVYRLAIHGPEALALLSGAGVDESVVTRLSAALACASATIAGCSVTLVRRDRCGVVGVELFVDRAAAEQVWQALLSQHDLTGGGRRRARPCGWFAFNTARIEGGTPLYEIDFGSTSLPHESGILDSRVSFTKGCYLGQEVVARMQSLGKPKQIVRAFRMESDALPCEGAGVFADEIVTAGAAPIGQVTSSTVSPMLSGAVIGFATLRLQHATPETRVWIEAGGTRHAARVQSALASVGDDDAKGAQVAGPTAP